MSCSQPSFVRNERVLVFPIDQEWASCPLLFQTVWAKSAHLKYVPLRARLIVRPQRLTREARCCATLLWCKVTVSQSWRCIKRSCQWKWQQASGERFCQSLTSLLTRTGKRFLQEKNIGFWCEWTGHNWPSNCRALQQYVVMKAKQEQVLAVRCPTCGARPGEKCELGTGQPRTEPHRDRRLVASDK